MVDRNVTLTFTTRELEVIATALAVVSESGPMCGLTKEVFDIAQRLQTGGYGEVHLQELLKLGRVAHHNYLEEIHGG